MWLDLERFGIFEFKNYGHIPHIVKDLINRVRKENPNGKLIKTDVGRLTLNFLMGFYDGDGNYQGDMAARILNTKKGFLDEIVDLYRIPNNVNVNNKRKIEKKPKGCLENKVSIILRAIVV